MTHVIYTVVYQECYRLGTDSEFLYIAKYLSVFQKGLKMIL